MSFDIAKLAKADQTRTATRTWPDGSTLSVSYRGGKLSPAVLRSVRDHATTDPTVLADLLASLVVAWDLADGDVPLEPTRAVIDQLDFEVLSVVLELVVEDIQAGPGNVPAA